MNKLVVISFILALYGNLADACKLCKDVTDQEVLESIQKLPETVFKVIPLAWEVLTNKNDEDDLVRSMSHAIKLVMPDKIWSENDENELQDLYFEEIFWPCLAINRIVGHHDLAKLPQTNERVRDMKKMDRYCTDLKGTPEEYLLYYLTLYYNE